jgi:hypothetical protein
MDKKQILEEALKVRKQEVLQYEINIENFKRAIKKIETNYANNVNLAPFKSQLIQLVEENEIQQLKSIIIRDVITEQLGEQQ